MAIFWKQHKHSRIKQIQINKTKRKLKLYFNKDKKSQFKLFYLSLLKEKKIDDAIDKGL